MRRPFIAAAVLASIAPLFVAVGCEDGPNDTYKAAPPGAGTNWNDGKTPSAVGSATQGFAIPTTGTNALDICTPAQVAQARQKFFPAPILPPGLAAGLDIAGGPDATHEGASGFVLGTPFVYTPSKETWTGATAEDAQRPDLLCQGTQQADIFGDAYSISWGDAGEVSVEYNSNNREIQNLNLQTGYQGTLEADSPDGKSHYVVSLQGKPMTVTTSSGTTSFTLDWTNQAALNTLAQNLYDAFRYTFQPNISANVNYSASANCIDSGYCIIGNNKNEGGYFFFTPLNLAIFVSTTVGTVQANSTPIIIEVGKVKVFGFSGATSLLKLDAAGVGPTATASGVLGTTKNCDYTLGLDFETFKANCVEPFTTQANAAALNQLEENKLFGALTHDDEVYTFDVNGIDPQFAATVADSSTTEIVGDHDRPGAGDLAYSLDIDQYANGPIANDYTNNDSTKPEDLHGLGIVTLEWANLVQQYMTTNFGVNTKLGDPACIAHPDRTTTPGKVCSGIEGIVTTANPAIVPAGSTMANNALGVTAVTDAGLGNLGIGLHPSTWYSYFCTDGGGLVAGVPKGYSNCATNYYFTAMLQQVQGAYGGPTATPAQLNDLRFYFQQWIYAYVKYMRLADTPAATLAQVDAVPVSANDLFYDTLGGGFEFAEYVDRSTVNATGDAPTDLRISVNLTTSVMNDFDYSRHNYRGEGMIYQALTTNPTDKPGAEGILLTNLVGSPLLQSLYNPPLCALFGPKQANNNQGGSSGTGNPNPLGCTSYGPLNADGSDLLTDDFGIPVLAPYVPIPVGGIPAVAANSTTGTVATPAIPANVANAFGQSAFAIPALGQSTIKNTSITVADGFLKPNPSALLESSLTTLEVFSNPYDSSSAAPATDKVLSALLPALPKGASVGFPVTIDGSRDKFVNTYNVDFSGITLSASVDYDYAIDPKDDSTSLAIKAIETTDYLGQVFLCAEPNATTGNPDLLAIRMYDSQLNLLAWIDSHPSAISDCDIRFKYSIYGNYLDYVTSASYGVRLSFNPGFGGAVVSDVTLFDPNVVAGLGE